MKGKTNSHKLEEYIPSEIVTVNVSGSDGVIPEGFEIAISKQVEMSTEYTLLAYIESTSAQYIDTGFKPNQDTRIITEAEFLLDSTVATYLYGARTSSSSNLCIFYLNKTYYRSGYNTTNQNFATTVTFTEKFKIDKNKNITILDDTTTKVHNITGDFACEYNLYIFALNAKGTASSMCKSKLYSMLIYDNDTIIRDYVPAKNLQGICGLYDKVNKTFNTSLTTTLFVGGPEIGLIYDTANLELLHTLTAPSATYKIPLDTTYIITTNQITGYKTINPMTYTASQLKRDIDIIYEIKEFGIFIMDSTGELQTVNSWDTTAVATGIALFTPECEFIIAPKNWYTYNSNNDGAWNGNTRSAWGGYNKTVTGIKTTTSESDAITDFAGSTNTDAIISQLKGTTDNYGQYYTGAPAAEYCRSYSNGCKGAGQWYLPAAGEMNQIVLNKAAIEEALTAISGELFSSPGYEWTSTQGGSSLAWYYRWSVGSFSRTDKGNAGYGVRPVCKIEDTTGNIITFKIGNISYLAENQMTWNDWVNSSYNTNGFKITSSKPYSPNGLPLLLNGSAVTYSDLIIPSEIYMPVKITANSAWKKSSASLNPDANSFLIYESYSNKAVASTAAIMYIDIDGLTEFTCYIRSYAESNYDYVMIGQLDQTLTNDTSYSSSSVVKAHTRGNQQSGTALSNYTKVTYSGIDGGLHRIYVVYRKDSSADDGKDCGYILIPK